MTAITTAARLLREAAAELKNAHTLGGDWGNEHEALDAYNEHMATATTLEHMARQCLQQIEEPAGAAPAAVAGPAWDKTRDSLATLLLGLVRRPFLDFDVACIALDAATEPGMPLAYMRHAPAAPALEAPAATAAPKREVTDGTRTLLEDCISAIRDYAGSRPEEGESWESWFEAAFDLCQSRVRRVFDDHALAAAPQAPAAPVANPAATWTSTDDGLPEHGDLVLCDFGLGHHGGGIRFGYEVLKWDEHHVVANVSRWLKLDRLLAAAKGEHGNG